MRRKVQGVAGAVATAVALTAGAAWAQGDYGDFAMDMGTKQPGAPATLQFDIVYRNGSDPNGKPPPISGAVFHLPEGTGIDTNAVPRCTATDEEIRAVGTGACPADSKVGSGKLTAITGFGPPADPANADVTIFNGDRQLIEVVTAPDTDRALGSDRVTIEGSTLTAHPPATPGGPPDGRTSVKEIHLMIDRTGYATAPPDCPSGGRWSYSSSYEFADGSRDENAGTLECSRAGAARPLIAVAARPATVRAGHRVTVRFGVRSSRASCRVAAKVRFAGKRAFTDSRGRARITTKLRPGRHRFSVSKRGCRTARGTLTATR